jgi:Periplasmic protease
VKKHTGKGSVQSIFPLSDGGGIRLTVSNYFLPSGRSFSIVGVSPDLPVVEAGGYFIFGSGTDFPFYYAVGLFSIWMDRYLLPLRLGIGAVVLYLDYLVFVGRRKDIPIDKWQMPQGGVDEGENLVDAMKRELKEGTSIINIKIIKEIDDWMEYELPEYLIGNL